MEPEKNKETLSFEEAKKLVDKLNTLKPGDLINDKKLPNKLRRAIAINFLSLSDDEYIWKVDEFSKIEIEPAIVKILNSFYFYQNPLDDQIYFLKVFLNELFLAKNLLLYQSFDFKTDPAISRDDDLRGELTYRNNVEIILDYVKEKIEAFLQYCSMAKELNYSKGNVNYTPNLSETQLSGYVKRYPKTMAEFKRLFPDANLNQPINDIRFQITEVYKDHYSNFKEVCIAMSEKFDGSDEAWLKCKPQIGKRKKGKV